MTQESSAVSKRAQVGIASAQGRQTKPSLDICEHSSKQVCLFRQSLAKEVSPSNIGKNRASEGSEP